MGDFNTSIRGTVLSPFRNVFYQVPQIALGTNQISGAVVAAGTSRAIILTGEQLQGIQPEEAVLSLMQGRNTPGVMDNHYQSNKVAVIWPANFSEGFVFQFFQYDKSSKSVLSALECSNVAASCAAYALLTGIAQLDENFSLYGINDNTGQHIVLTPTNISKPPWSHWKVRFIENDLKPNFFPVNDGLRCYVNNKEIEFWAFEKGNAFVFALANPETCSNQLIDTLADKSRQHIISQGGDVKKANALKIVLYAITGTENDAVEMNVACHFLGERHKSLPGSAAMALAGFLTQNHLIANLPEVPYGTFHFHMLHPSGQLRVQAHWAITEYGVQILATEFITPTAVLFDGVFFIDGEHYSEQ